MEHDTVKHTEELKKKKNESLTTDNAENKQDDEGLDKNIDSDVAEDADILLEDNMIIDMDEVKNKAGKMLPLMLYNTKRMMRLLIMRLFILLKTLN